MTLLRNPQELVVRRFARILIYGQPGIWKTTIALSSYKPVHVDFDWGADRIHPSHQVPTLQVNRYEDFIELINSPELNPFQTIVVDTVDKLLSYLTEYIGRRDPRYYQSDGTLTQKGYGARKVAFKAMLEMISAKNKHIIVVAHEKEDKHGENLYVRPDIGGSSSADLIKDLDLVGYLQAHGNQHVISFDPCEKFYAKNTCSLPEKMTLPVIIDKDGIVIAENNFMQKIIDRFNQKKAERDVAINNLNRLMLIIKENVESIIDVFSLNEVYQRIKTMEHLFDSKLRSFYMLQEKARTLDCRYSRQDDAFMVIPPEKTEVPQEVDESQRDSEVEEIGSSLD